jgi:hypothetical protein
MHRGIIHLAFVFVGWVVFRVRHVLHLKLCLCLTLTCVGDTNRSKASRIASLGAGWV